MDGIKKQGSISWRRRGVVSNPVYFLIDVKKYMEESYIHIEYIGSNITYTYRLLPFPCFLGGHRWFFECGATRNNDFCGNRVCILYENNGKFVCRECANLSYQSCNEPKLYRNNPFRLMMRVNRADEIRSKNKKKTYQGKPTRKYKRAIKLMGSITEEDIRNAESSLFKI